MSKQISSRLAISGKAYLALLITAAVLSALTVKAQGWLTSSLQVKSANPGAASAPDGQAMQTEPKMQAEIITITPRGFEPLEIRRAPGRFILMVENRSGLETVTFRLDQENGSRLYEKELPQEKPDWSEVIDLQPGTYQLTEADHADWLSRVTIAAE
jgi:hypothetical protein